MSLKNLIHVGTPNIGERKEFHRLVDEILDRRWLTNRGKLLREFEEMLSQYLGVKHCICVCNGTVGLEIAVQALGLKGQVIVPSLTFIATVHALYRSGIEPVFCDVDRESYNVDPSLIEPLITDQTAGIMGVHAYGRPCEIDSLSQIAEAQGLQLLFDAAHAFGCSYLGRMLGNFGSCEVFSFHATKFFNTCEGGAIATNDNALAEKIRLMLNFGFSGVDEVVSVGTNGKMSEIHAAMGLVNFKSMPKFIEQNRRNYECYREAIKGVKGVHLHELGEGQALNYQYVVVELKSDYQHARDLILERLHDRGILARRYFWPGCHRMEPYLSLKPEAGLHLPVTEDVAERILVLPTGQAIGREEIDTIVEVFN